MNQPNTLSTRLPEFIKTLYPWAHGHQVKAFVVFVGALLQAKSCRQSKLASEFENKKAALKRLPRFLHNPRLDTAALAEGVAQQFVAHLARHVCVRLALDWTVENDLHTLVATALIGRRGVPLYWRTYAAGSFKNHRSQLERAFCTRLFTVILKDVPRHLCILTADRGFADVQLFDLLDGLKVAFVIRTKDNVKVNWQGHWRKLSSLRLPGNTRRRSLGRLWYCERSPRRYYLTQSRARDRQGRWGLWHLLSNRNYTVLQAKQEYERRWGCECGFRAAKHLLGLAEARIEDPDAFARMFILVAIALLLLAIIACAFLADAPQARQRLQRCCTERGTHCDASFFAATLHLLKHDQSLWDYLVPAAKLNLDISLLNVS